MEISTPALKAQVFTAVGRIMVIHLRIMADMVILRPITADTATHRLTTDMVIHQRLRRRIGVVGPIPITVPIMADPITGRVGTVPAGARRLPSARVR